LKPTSSLSALRIAACWGARVRHGVTRKAGGMWPVCLALKHTRVPRTLWREAATPLTEEKQRKSNRVTSQGAKSVVDTRHGPAVLLRPRAACVGTHDRRAAQRSPRQRLARWAVALGPKPLHRRFCSALCPVAALQTNPLQSLLHSFGGNCDRRSTPTHTVVLSCKVMTLPRTEPFLKPPQHNRRDKGRQG
jgi:hypothetical protein